MESAMDFMGGFLLLAGASFLLFGGLGLLRMPDLYNRIQAGTKTTTLGTILVLAGAAFLHPEWGLKLLLIGLFLLFTNPLSSQVLARAAHRGGIEKTPETMVDKLAEDFPESIAKSTTSISSSSNKIGDKS
ncbi:MAG: monovalent cation/H(+) antiporter subunit G [gamma proteobacterium symbiont of Taylorina sp.]|nr:monovalent cation/H(+) antiporter subunit G [gamma proteobacterium symbiont of Taylorina sp.]